MTKTFKDVGEIVRASPYWEKRNVLLELSPMVRCGRCGGSGLELDENGEERRCADCDGRGEIWQGDEPDETPIGDPRE